jgi:PKD repeat protein
VLIEESARDPDGDGLYEDVNGDGETTILDVSSFLNVHDGETVAANRAKFDYNDDGEITILDVAQLLRMY